MLEHNAVTLGREQSRHQVKRLLASIRDDQVVAVPCNPARVCPFQEITTQRQITMRGSELQNTAGLVAVDHLFRQSPELRERKLFARWPGTRKTDLNVLRRRRQG